MASGLAARSGATATPRAAVGRSCSCSMHRTTRRRQSLAAASEHAVAEASTSARPPLAQQQERGAPPFPRLRLLGRAPPQPGGGSGPSSSGGGRPSGGGVDITIEKPSFSSRRIVAGVSIAAPPAGVWRALTDYDGLGDFIPSLVENTCLERRPAGALLYQVGGQEVALGVQFRAACTMDVAEHAGGLDPALCTSNGNGTGGSSKGDLARLFPYPSAALPGQPVHGDITFDLVEGDFNAFKGVWRVQEGDGGPATTWLVYAVYVKPQPWLPVALIEDRIAREVVGNLKAVRAHTEGRHREAAAPAAGAA